MGLFGGSSTTTTNESFDTGPSSFQQPYLTNAFNSANNAFNNSQGTPYYQGDTYASMSDEQRKALQGLTGFANGTGVGAANTISSIGQNLAGYSGQAGALIGDYLSQSDPTAITRTASQLSQSDPYLQQRIDAAAGDVTRNLNELTLPSIDRAASAGGNINSSRAGIASGIAQRGAAEAIGQISTDMRSDAYSQGLSLAQQGAESRLTGANAYGTLGSQGIDALERGASAGYDAYGQANLAGSLDQLDRQGTLDEAFSRWQGEDEREWDILSRYMGVVGSNQWGQSGTSSGTSRTSQSGGILSGLLSAGLGIAGSGLIPGIGG